MPYKKLKVLNYTEQDLRELWRIEYCQNPIITFDSVEVRFYEDMFDHAFYESSDRNDPEKDIYSLNRLEKILWIKEALKDATAILKQGWDRKDKKYFTDRRVSIVKGNYVVIIRFTGFRKAKFITAYEKNDIENILEGPDFDTDSCQYT